MLLTFVLLATTGQANTFDLQYEQLDDALKKLTKNERDTVNDTIRLIKENEHSLALARLGTLQQDHPENSSLRILASYVLLQAGNLIGSFEEARKASESADINPYKRWFMAKVAFLNGNTEVCRREIEHLKESGEMVAETKQLEAELEQN